MSQLSEFFESAKLPVMSEVAQALIRTLDDEAATGARIRQIIAKDPALTAHLLRLANSAHFGLSREVQSLEHAVTLLGLARVRALALSNCMGAAFPDVAGLSRLEFWQTSMACAAYAQWLAVQARMDTQQAWLSGLMLRLGELLMAQRVPEALVQIEARPCPALVRWEREQQLMGFDEGQVTAVLARHWNFPSAFEDALRCASSPLAGENFYPLAAVLHLAAQLADCPHPSPHCVQDLPQAVIIALGLNCKDLEDNFPEIHFALDADSL